MAMFQNKKAHFDPLCTGSFVATLIIGAILFSQIRNPPEMLIIIFALVAVTSQVIHIAHHGINPLGGVISLVILVTALFLLRYIFGNVDVVGRLLIDNLAFVVPAVVLLDGIKVVAS